jgi:hypothetical protein
MVIVRKLKTWVSMDKEKKRLLVEAFYYLAWARILKSLPFSRIAPSLGSQMEETTLDNNKSNYEIVRFVSDAVHIVSQYVFWESKCLVKAIAGMKILQRRGVESTLYLGTAKDESGKLIAHAWLRSGSFYVTGAEGMRKFTVVAKFANRIGDNE